MRSWIFTTLGALLSVLLWRAAQALPMREHLEGVEAMELKALIEDARTRISSVEQTLKANEEKASKANKAADALAAINS